MPRTAGSENAIGEAARTAAPMKPVWGTITARQRPDAASTEPKKCLLIPRMVIESSKTPTLVVDRSSSGTPTAPRSELPAAGVFGGGAGPEGVNGCEYF